MSTRADQPDPPEHVHLDTLADHLEGLLPAERAERVERHLADCDLCTGRVRDLRGVSSLLGSQPVPSMPQDVQERLQTALQAEVSGHRAPVPSLEHARQRRTRLGRTLLGAAAAVAVVAVGSVVVAEIDTGGSSDASSGQAGSVTAAERAPREAGPTEVLKDPSDAGVAPRVEQQPSLIEEIYRTRTVTVQRQRASCVGRAVGDPQWVGTSYAVDLDGKPAVVAFLGDADNTARQTTGVLVRCDDEPTVVQRQRLRR